MCARAVSSSVVRAIARAARGAAGGGAGEEGGPGLPKASAREEEGDRPERLVRHEEVGGEEERERVARHAVDRVPERAHVRLVARVEHTERVAARRRAQRRLQLERALQHAEEQRVQHEEHSERPDELVAQVAAQAERGPDAQRAAPLEHLHAPVDAEDERVLERVDRVVAGPDERRERVRLERVEAGEHQVREHERHGHRADAVDGHVGPRRQPAAVRVVQPDEHPTNDQTTEYCRDEWNRLTKRLPALHHHESEQTIRNWLFLSIYTRISGLVIICNFIW